MSEKLGPLESPSCSDRTGPKPCILAEGHDGNHAAIWHEMNAWALWRNLRPGAYLDPPMMRLYGQGIELGGVLDHIAKRA